MYYLETVFPVPTDGQTETDISTVTVDSSAQDGGELNRSMDNAVGGEISLGSLDDMTDNLTVVEGDNLAGESDALTQAKLTTADTDRSVCTIFVFYMYHVAV